MVKNILKTGVNLMLVCLIGGTILAITNLITEPEIERVKERDKVKTRQAVLPEAVQFKEFKERKGFFEGLDQDGRLVGFIISCLAEGYAGEFWVMVGVDKDFKIKEINILANRETPGLGSKIQEDSFKGQFKGKGIENLEVVKTQTLDKIEVITGATISSKAVTEAAREGLEELKRIVCKE